MRHNRTDSFMTHLLRYMALFDSLDTNHNIKRDGLLVRVNSRGPARPLRCTKSEVLGRLGSDV